MLAWNAHVLLGGEDSLFNANTFYPYSNTFALSEHLFGLSLLGLPFWLFTENALLANNAVLLLCLLLSSFTMYILAFNLTGNPRAGIVAGVIFAYNPFRVDQIDHLHLQGVFWLPLIALFLMRYIQWSRPRDLVLFAVVFFMQSVSGFYGAAAGAITIAVLALCGVAFTKKPRSKSRAVVGLGAAVTMVALLNLPFVLPYLRVRKELGLERSLGDAANFAAKPTDYLRVTPEHNLYGDWLGTLGGSPEGALFPGFAVILLVLLGLYAFIPWSWRKAADGLESLSAKGWEWAFLLLVVACFVLTLGPWIQVAGVTLRLPYFFMYEALPLMGALRVPSRFHLSLMLGIAAIAGIGYAFVDRQVRSRKRLYPGLLALAVIALLFAEYATLPFPAATSAFHQRHRDALDSRLSRLDDDAVVLELPMTVPPAPPWPTFDPTPYRYVYASTRHWRNLVNGVSGFRPPGYPELTDLLDTFPSLPARATLPDVGATHIVVHLDQFPAEARRRIEAIAATDPHLVLEGHFGESLLLSMPFTPADRLSAEWYVPDRAPSGHRILSEIELYDGAAPTTLYPSAPLRVSDTTAGPGMGELRAPSEVPVTSLPFSAVRIPLEIEIRGDVSDSLAIHMVVGSEQFLLASPKPAIDPALVTSLQPGVLRTRFERVATPARLDPGEPFWASLVVRNTGHGYWKARADSMSRGEVRLGLKDWRKVDGTATSAPGARGRLPRDVAPGEAVVVELTGPAPVDPGVYVARLEMVSEFVEWSSRLDPAAFVDAVVEVAPAKP